MSKVVSLFSGGVDALVSAHLLKEKGYEVVFAYANNQPHYTNEAPIERAIEIAKALSNGSNLKFYDIQHGKLIKFFAEKKPQLTCLLCGRTIYMLGNEIAKREGAKAIVTGEVLDHVASQTLDSLYRRESASKLPVFRPLLLFDEKKVEEIANSILPGIKHTEQRNGCGAVKYNPAQEVDLQVIQNIEKTLNVDSLVKHAIDNARIITV